MAMAGYFDRVNRGVLEGWAIANNPGNRVRICIGDHYTVTTTANRYRPDLGKAGIRDGYAYFSVPIPLQLLDGEEHDVTLLDADSGERLVQASLRLETLGNMSRVQKSVLATVGTLDADKTAKVAIFVGYERTPFVSQNSCNIIRALKNAGFQVVFVLAVDALEADDWLKESGADVVIVRKNLGYDFGSWACGYQYLRSQGLDACQQLLLMNDSVLWTGDTVDPGFFPSADDSTRPEVLGAVESFERKRHLQSYFLLLSRAVIASAHLDEFLLYQADLPTNKDEAIQHFELKTWSFFEKRGYRVASVLHYDDLASAALAAYELEAARLEAKAASHRWDHSARRLLHWRERMREGATCNPTHTAWFAVLDRQFPFLKKELVSRNPAEVPFYDRIRARFSGEGAAALREYLSRAEGALFPLRTAAADTVTPADASAVSP